MHYLPDRNLSSQKCYLSNSVLCIPLGPTLYIKRKGLQDMRMNWPCCYKKHALIKVVFRVNPIVLLVIGTQTAHILWATWPYVLKMEVLKNLTFWKLVQKNPKGHLGRNKKFGYRWYRALSWKRKKKNVSIVTGNKKKQFNLAVPHP